MAVPKKKVSPGRKKTRRQFYELTPTNVGSCPNCGSGRLPHRICSNCGHYRGRQVIDMGGSSKKATAAAPSS